MASLRQYVISIVCAALICSILSGIIQNGPTRNIIRLLCGLFLTLTVLHPISRLNLDPLLTGNLSYIQEAKRTAFQGKEMAEQTITDIIKTQSEAYILDKATELNAEITVKITVNDRLPATAELGGKISPYARYMLQSILETDLGITKENQIWTG